MGDCLKGKMIFELLILVSMKNTVLMDLMLIAWSVYTDISDESAVCMCPRIVCCCYGS